MAYWNDSVTENGVEVHYSSNCELYHLTNPETGEYDAKIDVYPNHIEDYSSETVTGISMIIIIRTVRGADQKYMAWREETGIPGKINC